MGIQWEMFEGHGIKYLPFLNEKMYRIYKLTGTYSDKYFKGNPNDIIANTSGQLVGLLLLKILNIQSTKKYKYLPLKLFAFINIIDVIFGYTYRNKYKYKRDKKHWHLIAKTL